MNFNLKNFPRYGSHTSEYDKWKEGFEKELREIKKKGETQGQDIPFVRGIIRTIKEILGE